MNFAASPTNTLPGHPTPWRWSTCSGDVDIPFDVFLTVIQNTQNESQHSARSVIEHYILMELLTAVDSGMGGLI